MSVLTGLFNEKMLYSGIEIAVSLNIPIFLFLVLIKEEWNQFQLILFSHAKKLKQINVNGIILNKVYDKNIFNNVANFISNKIKIDS